MRKIIQKKNSITNILFRSVIIPILVVYILLSVISICMQIYGIKQSTKEEAASRAEPVLKMISSKSFAAPVILKEFKNDKINMIILDSRKNIIHSSTSDISDTKKEMIKKNFERGLYNHILYKNKLDAKGISYFPIKNTPDWTLVMEVTLIKAFHSVYMHIIFLVTSTLTFILFFYFISRRVSKRLAFSVKQMADRLQLAAEGDFKSEVIYSDDVEEVKYLSEAIHSIVSRMNMALSGSDDFESSENIRQLLSLDVLKPLIANYKNSMKTNLCIKNAKGEVIAGEPAAENDAENIYTGNIVIKGRTIGTAELSPLEGCKPPRHELPIIVKQIAFTTSHMIEKSYNNAKQYDIWKKNEEYNIRNLTKAMEVFSTNMHQWLTEIEVNNFSNRKDFQADLLMFTAKAKEVLAYIDENSEYSKFIEYSADMKEDDYSPRDLSVELQKQISDSLSANDNVDFSISGKIPAKLFGDKNSIIKIIKRILITITTKNNELPVSLKISSQANKYSTLLIFELTTSMDALTDNEANRLKLISLSKNGFVENLTTFEQKIASAFNLAFKINAKIEIDAGEEFKIKISIPQLNVKELEEL